jgi:hypothetical protein
VQRHPAAVRPDQHRSVRLGQAQQPDADEPVRPQLRCAVEVAADLRRRPGEAELPGAAGLDLVDQHPVAAVAPDEVDPADADVELRAGEDPGRWGQQVPEVAAGQRGDVLPVRAGLDGGERGEGAVGGGTQVGRGGAAGAGGQGADRGVHEHADLSGPGELFVVVEHVRAPSGARRGGQSVAQPAAQQAAVLWADR